MPTIPRIDGGADRPGPGGEGAARAMRLTYDGLLREEALRRLPPPSSPAAT